MSELQSQGKNQTRRIFLIDKARRLNLARDFFIQAFKKMLDESCFYVRRILFCSQS
jgi:hypothetical protein